MRIRNIKPEFWRSDDISALPKVTRLTFIGLWSYVDDNGVGLDKSVNIAADLYANELAEDPSATLMQVSDDLKMLHQGGQILRYEANNKKLLYIVSWKLHQYIPKPSKGHMYPLPTAETVGTPDSHMQVTCDSHASVQVGTGGQGVRVTGGQGECDRGTGGAGGRSELALIDAPATVPAKTPRRAPRTRVDSNYMPPSKVADQIRMETGAQSEQLRYQHKKFIDHFLKKGDLMADWDACWRNWMRTAAERGELGRAPVPRLQGADKTASGWDTHREEN